MDGSSWLLDQATAMPATLSGQATAAVLYSGDGTPVYSPNVNKSASVTAAGDTSVWTPAAGKKFRLLRVQVLVTADAASAGGADVVFLLRDSGTGMNISWTVFCPAVAATTFGDGFNSGWIDLGGFGILSAAANNVLSMNLSAALSSGVCRVNVCGREE